MLEKNKDYVEFTLQCTTVERTSDKDYREVCFNGYSDYDFPGVPMDVVCKEFNHKVVMVSKRDFDRLQTENEQLKKKLEECEKDYVLARDKAEALEKEIGIYSRTLQEWKEGTGCPSPLAAKTLIESGMSWYHAYNEIKKANEKLGDDVNSWKNVTGYSTPESYLAARLNNAVWQKVTGFSTPEKCSSYIDRLEKKLEDIKNLTEED